MNNKKNRISSVFIVIIFSLILTLSCSAKRFYKIVRSEPSKPSLQKYHNIHIKWLPIDENEWDVYEYESKEQYALFIKQMNTEYLQKYIKDFLPKKHFTGSSAKNDNTIPKQTELIIKFKSIKLQHGGQVGVIDVDFIDNKTSKTVYNAQSVIYTKGVQYGFEMQVTDLVYYIDNFIYFQLTE